VRIEEGVIHIQGATLAGGYLGVGAEELIDPHVGFRTRDLGRIDAAGELHVLGRVDDLIISGGENVVPWEVEAALQGCPGVLEACVFGLSDPRWGEVVAAGLRIRADDDVASRIASVHGEARQRLAPFRRPRYYVCVPEFILGKNGKLDRRETARALRTQIERAPERHSAPTD
jgi:O-succinylbenzoic acid--CoA ligase